MRHSRPVISAPQNIDEASKLLLEIGELESEIERIRLSLKTEVALATAKAAEEAKPLTEELGIKLQALEVYATANKGTLIPDPKKKKSVTVPTGVFGWRTGNWCPIFDSEEALIAELEARGLEKYVKMVKALDAQGLVRDREKKELQEIPGLSFQRPERFYATPNKPKVEPDKTEKKA